MSLQTAFELGGYAEWTPLAEEMAYLDAVVALGPRVRLHTAQLSAGGLPVRVFEVSTSQDAPKGAMLLVGQQHGPEVAGREALLVLLREWATTSDPAVLAYLDQHRIYVIPTANPDGLPKPGLPNGTRGNADGVDINRDHCALLSPEGRLIQRMITEHRPGIVIDSHEQAGTAGTRIEYLRGVHPMVAPEIERLQARLEQELIAMANTYPGWSGRQFTLAPDPNPTLARTAVLRNALGILIESCGLDPTPRVDRYRLQKMSFELVQRFHAQHSARIAAACDAGRVRGVVRAADPARIYDWWTAQSPATPGGYFVTSAQYADHGYVWDAFGIAPVTVAGGYEIGIDSEFPLLATLLDSRSYSPAFVATPLAGATSDLRLINPGTGWVPCTAHALIAGAWQAPE
ncbi:M14 family zinc carboxypeptidase [Thauera butanivorans]|uniref:M14 family zinc carboxypeptidase n=1 Tax=Thauera butanivorans TaxID=86174 RepID=UPI0008389F07|nr:M14 family zinc carboxypeptidase [Thauera butanivorans]